MTPGSEVTTKLLMEQVAHTVRATLRRKSGLSLADDDARADNLDALDVYQDALVRVWERVGGVSAGAANVADLKAYAATVAHNLWSDYLRQRYPRRASLKNRLRYFLSHVPDYALWEGPGQVLQCGRSAWRYGTRPADPARIERLGVDSSWVPARAKPMERFSADDWNIFVAAVFTRSGAPIPFDDLVSLSVQVLEVRETRRESIDAEEGDSAEPGQLVDQLVRAPDTDLELSASIRRLWSAVKGLRSDYRCAYLLNIPGPGKSRADIEVFVELGVARVTEIGAVLGLSDAQYAIAWEALPLSPGDRSEVATLSTPEEKFCVLWTHLPLADALIARLLGIQPQQVINRRTLAVRELARALGKAEA
jgi:RNA polymerase sigma factor (sigma-70 family)